MGRARRQLVKRGTQKHGKSNDHGSKADEQPSQGMLEETWQIIPATAWELLEEWSLEQPARSNNE